MVGEIIKRHKYGANDSFCPKKENWHANAMLDAAGRCAKKYVGQEAVSVRAHRHQIAALLLDPFDNLAGWITISQFRVSWNSGGFKLRSGAPGSPTGTGSMPIVWATTRAMIFPA